MNLRYFSMGKVATRVWLFIILASTAVPIMHILFPYIITNDYYREYSHVEQMFSSIMEQQNTTVNETLSVSKALSGDASLKEKFSAILGLTPIGLSIRFIGMVLEGIVTGLQPVWLLLGFDKITTTTANGTVVSLADVLRGMLYMFYVWTIINIVTGREE